MIALSIKHHNDLTDPSQILRVIAFDDNGESFDLNIVPSKKIIKAESNEIELSVVSITHYDQTKDRTIDIEHFDLTELLSTITDIEILVPDVNIFRKPGDLSLYDVPVVNAKLDTHDITNKTVFAEDLAYNVQTKGV